MGKKKQKQQLSKISEATYLRSGRARKLPLHECFINNNWEDMGIATVVVSRRHINGNITFGCFLVDLYCLGVKNTWFMFNISELKYQDYLEHFLENMELESVVYEKVHNIIYGAIAFAEDYGFAPHEDFKLAQMILEEDTEAVPLIEYEFGVDGKPQLVVDSGDPKLPFYLNKLDKYAGKGNYEIVYMGFEDEEEYDEEEYDEENDFFEHESYGPDEWEDFILEADPESLLLLRYECFYIFEKAILEPAVAAKQLAVSGVSAMSDTEITYEPLENDQSKQETAEIQEIFDGLYDKDRSVRKLNLILNQIKSAVERWPKNPAFYNYLINAYALLKQGQQQKEATLSLIEQFPDYFFGKLTYARLLIDEGNLNAVPKVFNNHYDLKAVFPEREVFHISEVVSFNAIMCLYFVKKNDICSAYIYRKILAEMELPKHLQDQNAELFFRVDVSVIMEVKALVIEAQQDENKRKELVSALL